MMMKKCAGVMLALLCMNAAVVAASPYDETAVVRELEWTDLIPANSNPDDVLDKYRQKYNVDALPDDDPRVRELQDKLKEMFKDAPLNMALNGKMVKLPGYVVPLETNGSQSSEFLLVPYYGACIHVPPPPANQTVYVTTNDRKGAAIRQLYDVVWVTGMMWAVKQSTDLADTGYRIEATKVDPY